MAHVLAALRAACADDPSRLVEAVAILEQDQTLDADAVLARVDADRAEAAIRADAARVPTLVAERDAALAEVEALRAQIQTLTTERDNARAAAGLGADPVATAQPGADPDKLAPLDRVAASIRIRN